MEARKDTRRPQDIQEGGRAKAIPIPGGLNDDLAPGTLMSILRQAGIDVKQI